MTTFFFHPRFVDRAWGGGDAPIADEMGGRKNLILGWGFDNTEHFFALTSYIA